MPEIKIGTELACGRVIAINVDGVVFNHNKNPEPIQLSFNAIRSMYENDQVKK